MTVNLGPFPGWIFFFLNNIQQRLKVGEGWEVTVENSNISLYTNGSLFSSAT